MPGFVEGHAHVMEGSLWSKVYCGWFDRADPDGKLWSGVKAVDAVVARLQAAEAALEGSCCGCFGVAVGSDLYGQYYGDTRRS